MSTSKSEKAMELFHSGFNCAQSVMIPFCEKYGLDEKMALKVAGGLGGGVRCGEICGAASGAALVIGLARGQFEKGDLATKEACGKEVNAFMAAFRERNGALRCYDLLGLDVTTPEGHDEAKEKNLFRELCDDFVLGSIELLEKQGY